MDSRFGTQLRVTSLERKLGTPTRLSYLTSDRRRNATKSGHNRAVPFFGYHVPCILGLAWRRFSSNSGSKSKISGQILFFCFLFMRAILAQPSQLGRQRWKACLGRAFGQQMQKPDLESNLGWPRVRALIQVPRRPRRGP